MLAQDELIMIKGKRSKRARHASPLALTMATSSSTTAELSGSLITDSERIATSSPSHSWEITRTNVDEEEEEDMANCLILLARGHDHNKSSQPLVGKTSSTAEIFQCKTCNKSFHSFQALGGHRASHKRPNKPIMGFEERKYKEAEFQSETSTILSLKISNNNGVLGCNVRNKSRVHECSICGAEFASGQALGGHMRRHRPVVAATRTTESQELKRPRVVLSLDLNLPAPAEDENSRESSKFGYANKEQVLVFSASPLIDCHF